MAYKAKDIADYVVWHANAIRKKITNLQLQKIMYYLQAYNLIKHGEILYEDSIEKWKLGPVVDKVYQEYKGYGAKNIDSVPDKVDFDFEKGLTVSHFSIEKSPISKQTKDDLNPIIESLLKFEGYDLVKMTHKQPMWRKDKPKIDDGIRHIQYDNNEIEKYFTQNRNEQVWKEK
jgi:Uncharacterized phage-associated protein